MYDLKLRPLDFWDMEPREFKILYERHLEVQKNPTRRDLEIARFTAYLVVSSFTDLKGVTEFAPFEWDEKPKEKTLEEIEELFRT